MLQLAEILPVPERNHSMTSMRCDAPGNILWDCSCLNNQTKDRGLKWGNNKFPGKKVFWGQLSPVESLLLLKNEMTIIGGWKSILQQKHWVLGLSYTLTVTVEYRTLGWTVASPEMSFHMIWEIKETETLRNKCPVLLLCAGQQLGLVALLQTGTIEGWDRFVQQSHWTAVYSWADTQWG